jgi:hypothetical protein
MFHRWAVSIPMQIIPVMRADGHELKIKSRLTLETATLPRSIIAGARDDKP